MLTISDHLKSKQNNFDALRLLAALLVIFSHSFIMSGNPDDEVFAILTHGFNTFGGIAVSIFFVISGFLITSSYINRDNVILFLKSRILRIYPALIVCVLFCAFFIGKINTIETDYFSKKEVYEFIINNITMIKRGTLPGVFLNNHEIAVNGSLWTLPLEVIMYCTIAGFGILGVIKRKNAMNIILIPLLLLFWLICINESNKLLPYSKYYIPAIGFLVGSLFYINKEWIMLDWRILLLLMGLSFIAKWSIVFYPMLCLTFVYGILWLAFARNLNINMLTKYGDFSYGLYIYAFPIQQTLVNFFHIKSPYLLFFESAIITSVFAIFSWRIIEKPCLKLKDINFFGKLNFADAE